jgi:hypothetical protein
MQEERITSVQPARGDQPMTTHTTIIHDDEGRSGGMGWLIGLLVIVAIGAAIYFFAQGSASEAVKDNAIAGAAQDVGNAAQNVGEAAKQAADSLKQ